MRHIDLDANASTPVLPEVWEAMKPWMVADAGNPASSHGVGRRARRALEEARETVARLLNSQPQEIIFTSGATEANNLAIFGLTQAWAAGTVVASGIEHPCVLEPVAQLARRGFRVEWLPVSESGAVEALPGGWPADMRLLCVMLGNHETGAIQPVGALAATLPLGASLHCDAAAAAGKMPISFRDLGVTSLTITAHKFHGPKGIGALVFRKNAHLAPQVFGGHQQEGRRPGTEPVALAVGLARALEMATQRLALQHGHLRRLRQTFLALLQAQVPMVINGLEEGGLPTTANVSFPGCAADALLMALDLAGVACSTGSACSSGSLLPSPVLRAMGIATERLRSAMRFSWTGYHSEQELAEAAGRIVKVVNDLRRKAPVGSSAGP